VADLDVDRLAAVQEDLRRVEFDPVPRREKRESGGGRHRSPPKVFYWE
jgi:hypothetical protein